MSDRPSQRSALFRGNPPLSIAALDAAITETIGKPVRRDRLARDDRVYRWVCRRAAAAGSTTFNTTYAEAAAGSGYDVPRLNCRENRRQARHMRVSTVYRALSSLAGAGVLRFQGKKQPNGQWRCLTITLLPAGMGTPPVGRSRRRPRRRPCGRVSFSGQSGTSPAVAPSGANRSTALACARARERPPDGEARRSRSTIRSEIAWSLAGDDPSLADAEADRRYTRHARGVGGFEAVELCETFEDAFGKPSKFAFDRHLPRLERILARLDRYTGGRRGYEDAQGHGLQEARMIVREAGREARAGVGWAAKIDSLAYFLPLLDEISKGRRRLWKATKAEPWERSYPWGGLRGKAA